MAELVRDDSLDGRIARFDSQRFSGDGRSHRRANAMRLVPRLLLLGGFGLLLIGGFDVSLLLRGSAEPDRITLQELGQKNGTGNVHLSITDYVVGSGMVMEKDDNDGGKRIWMRRHTPTGEWTDRPIIAHARVSDQAQLDRFLERSSLTCVVTNGLQGVGKYQQEKFAESYPGVNLDSAIAFQVDRRFPSPFVAFPVTIIGLLMFGIGLASLFGFLRKNGQTTNSPTDG